jgi:hypothetical protein
VHALARQGEKATLVLRAKPRFVARDEAVESSARKEEELARPERFELPTYWSGGNFGAFARSGSESQVIAISESVPDCNSLNIHPSNQVVTLSATVRGIRNLLPNPISSRNFNPRFRLPHGDLPVRVSSARW